MTYQERKWLRRAITLHLKALDLADAIEKVEGPDSQLYATASQCAVFQFELVNALGGYPHDRAALSTHRSGGK